MGMAAILVMWSIPSEQTFVPTTHGGSTWNLASMGPAVLKMMMFENGGRQRWTEGRDGVCLSYKLTYEP